MAAEHVQHDHVFGLEAAGEADGRAGCLADDLLDQGFGGEEFELGD
jgi:hypothetical protein